MQRSAQIALLATGLVGILIVAAILLCSLNEGKDKAGFETREPTAQISADLKNGQLVVDGQTDIRLSEYCSAKFRKLTGRPPNAPAEVVETSVTIIMHPDLSYDVLQTILLAICRLGFYRFELVVPGREEPIRFELPVGYSALPDGEHTSLTIEVHSADAGTLDTSELARVSQTQGPRLARLRPDGAIAISELTEILSIVTSVTHRRVVGLVPTPPQRSGGPVTGKHTMACTWSLQKVTVRQGCCMQEIVVPPDILEKAQLGDQAEMLDEKGKR